MNIFALITEHTEEGIDHISLHETLESALDAALGQISTFDYSDERDDELLARLRASFTAHGSAFMGISEQGDDEGSEMDAWITLVARELSA